MKKRSKALDRFFNILLTAFIIAAQTIPLEAAPVPLTAQQDLNPGKSISSSPAEPAAVIPASSQSLSDTNPLSAAETKTKIFNVTYFPDRKTIKTSEEFSYEKGLLVASVYLENNDQGLRIRSLKRTYHADGRTVKTQEEERYENNAVIWAVVYNYNWLGQTINRMERTYHPNQALKTQEYSLYQNGLSALTILHFYNDQNKILRYLEKSFYPNGRIKTLQDRYYENQSAAVQYDYKYDESGNMVQRTERNYYPGGVKLKNAQYAAYAGGSATSVVYYEYNEAAQIIHRIERFFHPNGKVKALGDVWYENQKVSQRYDYQYDEAGRTITRLARTYYANGTSLKTSDLTEYDNGVLFRIYRLAYFENGKMNTSDEFLYANGIKTSRIYIVFNNRGSRLRLSKESFYPGGTVQVSQNYHYSDGKLKKYDYQHRDKTGNVKESFNTQYPQTIWINQSQTTVFFNADGVDFQRTFKLADGTNKLQSTITGYGGHKVTLEWVIIRDTLPPSGEIKINRGEAYTFSRQVALSLASEDASGVNGMRFSMDGGKTWSAWEEAKQTKNITLSEGSGLKTVHYQLRDKAGNVSTLSDSILYRVPLADFELLSETTVTAPFYELRYRLNGKEVTEQWQLHDGENKILIANALDEKGAPVYTQFTVTLNKRKAAVPEMPGIPDLGANVQTSETAEGLIAKRLDGRLAAIEKPGAYEIFYPELDSNVNLTGGMIVYANGDKLLFKDGLRIYQAAANGDKTFFNADGTAARFVTASGQTVHFAYRYGPDGTILQVLRQEENGLSLYQDGKPLWIAMTDGTEIRYENGIPKEIHDASGNRLTSVPPLNLISLPSEHRFERPEIVARLGGADVGVDAVVSWGAKDEPLNPKSYLARLAKMNPTHNIFSLWVRDQQQLDTLHINLAKFFKEVRDGWEYEPKKKVLLRIDVGRELSDPELPLKNPKYYMDIFDEILSRIRAEGDIMDKILGISLGEEVYPDPKDPAKPRLNLLKSIYEHVKAKHPEVRFYGWMSPMTAHPGNVNFDLSFFDGWIMNDYLANKDLYPDSRFRTSNDPYRRLLQHNLLTGKPVIAVNFASAWYPEWWDPNGSVKMLERLREQIEMNIANDVPTNWYWTSFKGNAQYPPDPEDPLIQQITQIVYELSEKIHNSQAGGKSAVADFWSNDYRPLMLQASKPSYKSDFSNSMFLNDTEGSGFRDFILDKGGLAVRGHQGRKVNASIVYHFASSAPFKAMTISAKAQVDEDLNGKVEMLVSNDGGQTWVSIAQKKSNEGGDSLSAMLPAQFHGSKNILVKLAVTGESGTLQKPAARLYDLTIS